MGETQTTENAVYEFRVSEFTEMGFRKSEAIALAQSKDETGYPLDIHKVRRALAQGCTHMQAWRIFNGE